MIATQSPNGHELRDRAREMAATLVTRSPSAEEMRAIPDETMKEFHDADFFRALQPARYGGLEIDPVDFFDAVLEVGASCGSSAWVLGVIAVHSWQLALFPGEAQDEVWGQDDKVLVSSSYAPTGTVEQTDGGYLLKGRWGFSSGCDHARWVFLGGVVPRGNVKPPDMRTFLVPESDYRIEDNWHVAGLSGSGSKDIVIDRAFVPEYRTHPFQNVLALDSPGNAVNPAPLYRIPFGGIFCNAVAAPALGVALGASRRFLELCRTRVNANRTKSIDDPYAQLRLAEVTAAVDGAVLQMRHNFGEMMHLARTGSRPSMTRRARYRFDASRATRIATECVDSVFAASGGRALLLDNWLQRGFRDVHAMRNHASNNPEHAAQIYARAELGFPNKEFLI
jgi:3-hydroxy-9,10-secoandrosta-1,3,5(10)-triene-9,17-dione monooxygenase